MTLDLTDDEPRALAKHLRQTIDNHRYPLVPRLDPLETILAKLDPSMPQLVPLPPLTHGMLSFFDCPFLTRIPRMKPRF
jgi:hypothetical protein